MGTHAERRDQNASRKSIRATVDLTPGDDARESWQADAIDLSMGGMSMRANVLPEVGERLSLMFRHEGTHTIAARGEVVWALDKGPHAGAFGVRFTDVPPAAEQSLRRMLDEKDDVMVSDVKLPPEDARVKLFIQGMDAPLRARVRTTGQGEMVVGSDLSFLKLGDKVDVDGGASKVSGVIDRVDVEVDPKTRVPRLVLSIDLGGKKKVDVEAPTVLLEHAGQAPVDVSVKPRVSRASVRPEAPKAEAVTVREEPVREEASSVAPEAKPAREARKARIAQATTVIPSDDAAPEAETSAHDESTSSFSDDEPAPGWLTQGVRSVRGAYDRVSENAGPAMRRAIDAVGGLRARLGRGDADAMNDDGEAPTRRGLRPQHPAETSSDDGDAVVTTPGRRNRKVGLYAVVGLVLAAGIVAYASSSGPRVETPHPQVAVNADPNAPADPNAAPADPNAPAADPNAPAATDPNAAPETAMAGDPAMQSEPGANPAQAQPEPRWIAGQNPRTPDLAAASQNAQGAGEAPVIQNAPVRAARPMLPAARPLAQRPMVAPQQPSQRVAMQPAPVAQRVAMQTVPTVQGPVRPVVFGNANVRAGTTLRLRMDGPVAAIQGVGARGAQITLSIPGRRSLDVAAPFVQADPRIAGAGVLNGAQGANLTLRFREAAPPFVARSRGNVLEITLAPTPGSAPMRAAVRPAFRTR